MKDSTKTLPGIIVYVSCSCAPHLLSRCAFTLHIRQSLATFTVIQFAPHLTHLVKINKFSFLYTRLLDVVYFSTLMCLVNKKNHKISPVNTFDIQK